MKKYPLPFPHEPISFEYIDSRDTIVANPDLKEIASILMITRGFGVICNQDLLAEAMYEHAIASERSSIAGRKNPDRKTKGIFRLENVLSGGSRISFREIEVFWKALQIAFGVSAAGKFTPRELAQMSVAEFKQRLVKATAVLPEALSPENRLHMMAAMAPAGGLRITPSFAGAQRVGAMPGSLLAQAPTLGTYVRIKPTQRFRLEIDGLAPGQDLLVIEAARDPIDLSNGTLPQVFPAGRITADSERLALETSQGEFEVGVAEGEFTYFSACGDLASLSFPHERLQAGSHPFTLEESQILINDLFAILQSSPDGFRMARYTYHVSA